MAEAEIRAGIGEQDAEDSKSTMTQMSKLQALTSSLVKRQELANTAGMQFGGKRDLYDIYGYEKTPTYKHFLAKYRRQDIASRVVDALPSATWRGGGVKIEDNDALATAWDEISREHALPLTFQRADRLSSMGRFSLLLLGFNDTGNLERPVASERVSELLYVNPVADASVSDIQFVERITDKRYGKPEMYSIQMNQHEFTSQNGGSAGQANLRKISDRIANQGIRSDAIKVHWTRVIHIVDNPLEDDTYSVPMMERVYNLLDDLLKVSGGSAENFWLSANRGLQADIDPEVDFDPEDAEALKDEIDEYMHQLRRFIRTRGVKMNVLDTKMGSPRDVFDMLVSLISGTTGMPRRVLLGAEAGVIASEQDRASWAERIAEHRDLCVEPCVIYPFIGRLQEYGLLPDGDYNLSWPEAFVLNPLEEGQMMAQKARAVGNLSRQTGNNMPMQVTTREEARKVIMLEGDIPEDDLLVTFDVDDSEADVDDPEDDPANEIDDGERRRQDDEDANGNRREGEDEIERTSN